MSQAAVDGGQFELTTELLRFVVPPGSSDAFLTAVRRSAATAPAAAADGGDTQAASSPEEVPKAAGVRDGSMKRQTIQKPWIPNNEIDAWLLTRMMCVVRLIGRRCSLSWHSQRLSKWSLHD